MSENDPIRLKPGKHYYLPEMKIYLRVICGVILSECAPIQYAWVVEQKTSRGKWSFEYFCMDEEYSVTEISESEWIDIAT